MKTLDPLTLPLNQPCLIEASAGTGKTYTIVNLYLRLLLGVSCDPLMVEQILVVTFTKSATQELRDRIREKVIVVARLFSAYQQGNHQALENDAFLLDLYYAVEQRLPEALLRLKLAARDIDLASIFTIDSFCQKMLFQFAFDSGIRFDIELHTNEDELLRMLSEQTWRKYYYPLDFDATKIVAEELKNPEFALKLVKPYLYGILPPLTSEQLWITQDFSDYIRQYQHFQQTSRTYWLTHCAEISTLIYQELAKTYKKGEKKSLSRRSYQQRWLANWLAEIDLWATGKQDNFPVESLSRFSQQTLNEKAEEGAIPLEHLHFAEIEAQLTAYQQQFEGKLSALLRYQFLQHLRQALSTYKATHKEKSFGDILSALHQALHAERGEALAANIRALFPFAMIDEFQDTNQEQYEIFQRIFLAQEKATHGFIMIGDPKQSIYKFRGADIFTYLTAASQVSYKATLTQNWRSAADIVNFTNALFQFPNSSYSPFVYQGIQFHPVQAKISDNPLCGEASVNCYLQPTFDEQQAAERCAYHIQQQLQKAATEALYYHTKGVQKNGEKRPLEAQDIAILVRSHTQATLIRQALLARQIQSVFLSEKSSVYQSQEAQDLRFILRACLNPYQQTAVLSALGTQLWGLDLAQVFELKQDENAWDRWIDTFVKYHKIWQQQGILPMLHQLFIQQGIIERMHSTLLADRRMTDLLHLAELLQNAMGNTENEFALLRWYEQQLDKPDGQQDEQTLRLESEESLIKIITIHGSKGLEYPIVWLPFVGKASHLTKNQLITTYHDHQQQKRWHFGRHSDEVDSALAQAEFAEDVRLLYVAITRAKYQLNMLLPTQFETGWSAMSYLLTNAEIRFEQVAPSCSTADYIQQKNIPCQLIDDSQAAENLQDSEDLEIAVSDRQNVSQQLEQYQTTNIQAREFSGQIKTTGQVTSFSALQAQNERLQNFIHKSPLTSWQDDGQDYDYQQTYAQQILNTTAVLEPDNVSQPYSPYLFPHSTKVGTLLHKLLEHWDFRQPLALEAITQLCATLGLSSEWIEPLQHWFSQIARTPFGKPAFSLSQIDPTQRLNEWQFYLRLRNVNALPKLNQLLNKYSVLAQKLPDLQLPQLEGFVRGFVDCIVKIHGKFYLIDYKSNFLGYFAQDYTPEKLKTVMGKYRYDLQYLLYILALHRYLGSRLQQDYDYDRDVGGIAYLFLRGMNGEPNKGVFFEKPSAELVEALDKLFD